MLFCKNKKANPEDQGYQKPRRSLRKWLFKRVLILSILVIGFTSFLNYFLPINDLANCGDRPNQDQPGCLKADYIVAISGGDTEARTKEAIRLYQQGWADKLLFSGAAKDKSGPSNAEVMLKMAVSSGIDPSAIQIEENSNNTKENARNTSSILNSLNTKRIILVTSKYHQRRAYLEFHKTLPNAVIVNHPTDQDVYWPKIWFFKLRSWYLALGELGRIIAFYISD